MAFKLCIAYILKLIVIIIFIVNFISITNVLGARRHRAKPPLIEETTRRRTVKPNVCQFGNQSYSISQQWKPNLGPPIGTLFCVHCECVAVTKKHRKETVARVRCRNIKDECPKPNCDNPILLPDACCKTCPNENDDDISIKDLKYSNEYSTKDKSELLNNDELKDAKKDKSDGVGAAAAADVIVGGDAGEESSKSKENLNPMTIYLSDDANDLTSNENNLVRKCVYEKQEYDEAAQWKSLFNDCEMCSCQKGRIKCEPIICPEINCTKTTIIKGQCCPSCADEIKNESLINNFNETNLSCEFAGRKRYVPGSKWHPYLPPFGFDRCTICQCLETLQVKCSRSECPPLACPEHEAYRENDMDCCKRCPNVIIKAPIDTNQLGDQRAEITTWQKTSRELLAEGGCKQKGRVFANGDDWHPNIHPIGEYKCVKCNCKDGHITCKRLECPALSCPVKIFAPNECCPRCGESGDTSDKSLLINSKKSNRRRKNRRKDFFTQNY